MFIPLRHLRSCRAIGPASALLLLLAACSPVGNGCDEFAVPADRKPTSCPPPKTTPASVEAQKPKQYCYQTLGEQSDCYSMPIPGRPGLTGVYPTPASGS